MGDPARLDRQEAKTFSLTAVMANGWAADLPQVKAYAVCQDAAGAINAGGAGLVELLPANGESGATFRMTGTMPSDPWRCTVAAAPNTPMRGRGA